ncbi:response regulator [Polaromonas sp. YR568]|uniref:response regulator n=1 Tax=Polaromonas sp. YR568 TaxID=1855301 RepID=UPI003137BABF
MSLSQATILIVDDDQQNRKLIEALLRPEGYRTVSAASGEEAMIMTAQHMPDLVLLDVMMPDMDGYEVARALKAHPATSNIPIIMLTALADRTARLAGLNAGAEEFLTKPVDRTELWLRVRNLLRLKEYSDFLQNHSDVLQARVTAQVEARTADLQRANQLQLDDAARQASILNALPAHIALLDHEGVIISVNDAWRHFACQDSPQSQGCGPGANYLDICDQAIGPDAREADQAAAGIRAVLSGSIKSYSLEYPCHSPDDDRWFVMTVCPLSDGPPGKGVIVMHMNVTVQKLASDEILRLNSELEERVRKRTAELETANRELEAFSYSVSHDLRNPLNTIDGFSDLLHKEINTAAQHNGSERSQHYLSRIRSGVVQMGELIDALLSLAQVSRTTLRWEPIDLSAMAGTLLAVYHEREPARQVEVTIEPGLTAAGDPALLRQVLENLLANAWKFSGKKTKPAIRFASTLNTAGQRVYSVQDNGAGFDMAYGDKLFGAFQRLHTAAEFSGTGIGLATVQRIIKRHGGQVWAEGILGEGARFSFTLGTAPA